MVNIAVCGKFHYPHYVQFIERAGMLGQFYFSHRLSTGAAALHIDTKRVHNLFLKEYLGFLHRQVFGGINYLKWITLYQDIWERQVLKEWQRCDILHSINHGAAARIAKRAKAEGSIVLGEPVNSHPENMFSLVQGEHQRLGLPYYESLPDTFRRMMEEEVHFDYYLSPSSFVTNSYLTRGVPPEKIFTLPFGVNLKGFQFFRKPKEKFRVIYVAQITPRKGHIDLINAWKLLRLPKDSAELILIGHVDPIMKPFMKQHQDTFTYLGTVPNNELVNYYNDASVFVMPSVEEGCSYAPLEAMASGLPVILTENTGSGELVSHSKEGFIVPIRDPEKIAYFIEALYRDNDLCLSMGQLAADKAKEGFGWDVYAEKLITIYNRLLSR